MNETNPETRPPVLPYAPRPRRLPDLILSSMAAAAGMILWYIGVPGIMFAGVCAVQSIISRSAPGFIASVLFAFIGLVICYLAFCLCRRVESIDEDAD